MFATDRVFESRVARRILGSFALATLAPAILTAALAYFAVERQLIEKSYEQLQGESKNYSLDILQRLNLARVALEYLEGGQLGDFTDNSDGYFSQVKIAPLDNQLTASEAVLEVKAQDDSPSVWITIKRSATEVISGQINPAYLWGGIDAFPAAVSFCVLDDVGAVIFCPEIPDTRSIGLWHQALEQSSSGTQRWDSIDAQQLVGYFTVPMYREFSVPGWSIAAIQSEVDALAPMSGFRVIFPAAISLSILLTLWFSFHQIRRRLAPLQTLTEATSSIADGDFSSSIELGDNDEFQSLAQSFNSMRRDLGRQFRTLRALSELDQSILETSEMQPVVESTILEILEIFDCQCAAIAVVEKEAENIAQIHWIDDRKLAAVDRFHLPISDRVFEEFAPYSVPSGDACAPYLKPLNNSGATIYQVVPIIDGEHLVGVIALGYHDPESFDASAAETLLEFRNRLAVALQAIDRTEQLYTKAHYDSLTTLPNRQLFKDRLEQSISQTIAHEYTSALLFVDLDHFKTVNDAEGHSIGDELLQHAAQRILSCASSTDTVARLGGDEFTVILSDLSSPLDAARVGERIIETLSEPFDTATTEHFISASIGIAMIPDDGTTAETLLRNADTAMYRAKESGRGRSIYFEERMNSDAENRVSLMADLQHALERKEFELYYQPKIDLNTRQAVGAEALIRWLHPVRGLVPPDQFIPLAEESNLIVEIGEWVVREGVRQLSAWQAKGVLYELSLNVSNRQLRDANILTVLEHVLSEYDLAPGSLELEVTESLMAEDIDGMAAILDDIRRLELRVAIDDFGTGYSSFSYLSELSFDTLKIDQTFLQKFPENRERSAIVAAIIEIGTRLQKSVVAEGVETENQARALLSYGCLIGQGHLFSRPLTASDLESFVAQRESRETA